MVEHKPLPFVERGGRSQLPEASFGENSCQCGLRTIDSTRHAVEEPFHPSGDVHRALLGMFEPAVISTTFPPDLRRHAVEALRALLCTSQAHISDGARHAAVAIVEGMYRHKPEVSNRSLNYPVLFIRLIEPAKECTHLPRQLRGRWSFEVNPLPPKRPGDHLHRALGIVPPSAGPDLLHTAASCWKERCVPAVQPVGGERFVVLPCRVEHHLNHTFHVP